MENISVLISSYLSTEPFDLSWHIDHLGTSP